MHDTDCRQWHRSRLNRSPVQRRSAWMMHPRPGTNGRTSGPGSGSHRAAGPPRAEARTRKVGKRNVEAGSRFLSPRSSPAAPSRGVRLPLQPGRVPARSPRSRRAPSCAEHRFHGRGRVARAARRGEAALGKRGRDLAQRQARTLAAQLVCCLHQRGVRFGIGLAATALACCTRVRAAFDLATRLAFSNWLIAPRTCRTYRKPDPRNPDLVRVYFRHPKTQQLTPLPNDETSEECAHQAQPR
jgi:hypothetical protein